MTRSGVHSEGSFWNEEQRRGRLKKPRLEWFLQSALQAELADNVDIGKLYADYRRFGMGQRTPVPAERQLRMLTEYAEHYQQFTSGSGSEPIALFGKRMANWDASPTHSLACTACGSTNRVQLVDEQGSRVARIRRS
jgi:hypothetical protein